MENLIMFGGWIFWSLIALYVIVVVFIIERDGLAQIGWPLVLTAGLLAFFYFNGKTEFVGFFNGLPGIGWIIGGYLVAGIVWSFFRWLRFVKKAYLKYKNAIKEVPRYAEETPEKKAVWLKERKEMYMPVASDNKEQLSTWVTFWPFSVIRWVFNDFITYLVEKLGVVYDKIAESQFKD